MARTKHKLFGNHITPDCRYCGHNNTPEESPMCRLHKTIQEDGHCTAFSYDPLQRKPQNLPPLQQFDPDEFKL